MGGMKSGTCSRKTRYNPRHLLLCCFPVLAYSGVAYSQDQNNSDDKEVGRINTISVYGQALSDDSQTTVPKELWVGGKVATNVLDTPASVSVITQKEMDQRDVATTEEILQYSPGLLTDYYGSDDRNDYFKIRGYEATTYRDGMTLGSMRSVREDPYAFERVEVIRGANSTLFGPADPGGSVNFVSKRPKFERFGSSYVSYGSFDHKEMGLDFGDTIDDEQTVAYRLTTKIKDSDLEYDHSKDNSQFVMAGLSWQPSLDTTATLIVDYLGRDSTPNSGGYPLDKEYDRSDFFGEPDYNKHNVDRANVTAQISHYFDNGMKLSGNLRYSHLRDDFGYIYIQDSDTRTGSIVGRTYYGTDTDSTQFIGNAILQYDTSFGRIDSSSLIGLEYRDSSTKAETVYGTATSIDVSNPTYSGKPTTLSPYDASYQDAKATTKSVFLQQNFSFDSRYILTVGVRHDFMDLSNRDVNNALSSDDFSETSLRAALTYKVSQEWATYISQVESVAPPTIGVKPERGNQIELGVKYAPQEINALFSAAIYELKKKNIVMAVVKENDIDREIVGSTRVRGLDLEMKMDVIEDFNVTAGYSYMKSEVLRGTASAKKGNEFTSTPNNTASVWGYYTLPNKTMDVGLGARYIGSYFFNAGNTSKSEDATLLDAAFSYNINKATKFSFNVHNLTDKQYVVGSGTADYYNPGRSFNATLKYDW